jgi:hypothetical protein
MRLTKKLATLADLERLPPFFASASRPRTYASATFT